MKKKLSKGISIIETVVAMVILAVIGVALITLTLQIQSVANSAKFKSLAEGFGQAMIEQVRNLKAQGWSNLSRGCYVYGNLAAGPAFGNNYCNKNSVLTDPNLKLSPDVRFSGYVNLIPQGTGFQVQSVVYWSEKGNLNKQTEIDTFLYDY